MLTCCVSIELVMLCIWWDNDMPGCEEEDSLAFTAFTYEKTSHALTMRSGLGTNLQAECRSEGTAYSGSCMIRGHIIIKSRTG